MKSRGYYATEKKIVSVIERTFLMPQPLIFPIFLGFSHIKMRETGKKARKVLIGLETVVQYKKLLFAWQEIQGRRIVSRRSRLTMSIEAE